MTTPLAEFLGNFKELHGMYVMRKTYEGTCAFLDGYDLGSGNRILKQFHSWLIPRGKGRPELYWPYLVLCEIYDDGAWPDIRYFTPEQDEQAVAKLFDLLDAFFEESHQEASGTGLDGSP